LEVVRLGGRLMTLREVILEPLFNRPLQGLGKGCTPVNPALEVLGYYRPSAKADWSQ
jgi:hypothetical protein